MSKVKEANRLANEINEVITRISSQTRSVRGILYETLKEDILSEQYEAGFHLRERELAKTFGVSTTPLKEALRRLEQEGLVYTVPRKGTFVSKSIMSSVEEINWARSSLEGVAARLAAMKITEEELEKLEAVIEKMAIYTEEKNSEELIKLNLIYHQLIRKAAKNDYIDQQIEAVRSFDRYTRKKALAYTEEIERAYLDHYRIFEKIKAHDLDGAEEAMRSHIRRTASFIKEKTKE